MPSMGANPGSDSSCGVSPVKEIAAQLRYTRARAIATGQAQRFRIDPRAHQWEAAGDRRGAIDASLAVRFTGAREAQARGHVACDQRDAVLADVEAAGVVFAVDADLRAGRHDRAGVDDRALDGQWVDRFTLAIQHLSARCDQQGVRQWAVPLFIEQIGEAVTIFDGQMVVLGRDKLFLQNFQGGFALIGFVHADRHQFQLAVAIHAMDRDELWQFDNARCTPRCPNVD